MQSSAHPPIQPNSQSITSERNVVSYIGLGQHRKLNRNSSDYNDAITQTKELSNSTI